MPTIIPKAILDNIEHLKKSKPPHHAIRCTHFISLKANPRIEAQIFAIHVT